MLDVSKNQPPIPDTVEWHAVQTGYPDADVTVLIYMPEALGDPVWFGYYDDQELAWFYPSSDRAGGMVTYWAHLPKGPSDDSRTH